MTQEGYREFTEEEQQICKDCRECCNWMTFTLRMFEQQMPTNIEYYKTRGCKVESIFVESQKAQIAGKEQVFNMFDLRVMVPFRCPYITVDKGCMIYEKRPVHCRYYDGREDPCLAHLCKLPKEKNNAGTS
jgi:Fe-S-cluster containining protein